MGLLACFFLACHALIFLLFGTAYPASFDEPDRAEKLRAILEAPLPESVNKEQLAKAYLQRAAAARSLEDLERELKELNDGVQAVSPNSPAAYPLFDRMASHFLDKGDYIRAKQARESALKVADRPGEQLSQLTLLVGIASRLRDHVAAKAFLTRAEATLSERKRAGKLAWSNFGDLWQAMVANAKARFNQSLGYLAEAEANYRACIGSMRSHLGKKADAAVRPYFYLSACSSGLLRTLLRQGRLREAAAYVNDFRQMTEAFAEKHERQLFIPRMSPVIAQVYIEQGRIKEAKEVLETAMSRIQTEERGEASLHLANVRTVLATVEMLQGNWKGAEQMFRERRTGVRSYGDDGEHARQTGIYSPEWGYTLLRLGRIKQAVEMLDQVMRLREKRYDERSIDLWEGRAFYALAIGAAGRREEAVKILSTAIPKILEISKGEGLSNESGVLYAARLHWILDGYILSLGELYRSGIRPDGLDPMADAFRWADLARGSRVQRALAAAILRASIDDPQLAALVRKAQDLEHQLSATSDALTELLGEQPGPEIDQIVAATRADLERLRSEHETTQRELKRRLPDYSGLLSPKPLTILEAQKLLRPEEALISIYTTQARTLVWAIPGQGKPHFDVLDLPASAVSELVAKLRKTLDPEDTSIEQIPAFDFATAHHLYRNLLAPVEAGWRGAKELIVVPYGALDQLPFAVLVTDAYKTDRTGLPFADHAAAPWLLRQATISHLPSVSALASLRGMPRRAPERIFVGFGDPTFTAVAPAESLAATSSRSLRRRNLKLPPQSARAAAERQSKSQSLELLQPLPDTAEEIREIANILGANNSRDVYLGPRASEQNLKSADLARYRIVMFATHGLTPGEFPELDQPALGLSNPIISGEREDGLLMLSEVLGLKLQADWVVLSACNTASADGQAAEGISGLGRAFFYAGARALLVSHWPVETVSARLLTTELFRRQKENSRLGRAQALREASLAIMQKSAKLDSGNSFSYAHPMFWAPFVLVGDGG